VKLSAKSREGLDAQDLGASRRRSHRPAPEKFIYTNGCNTCKSKYRGANDLNSSIITNSNQVKRLKKRKGDKNNWQLHVMILPALILLIVFAYIPMYGNIIAFQNFIPAKGLFGSQEWVGLSNFIFALKLPDTVRILRNTVLIAMGKIILGLIVPIFFAILINEVINLKFKKVVQTLVYIPNFLSWVLLGGILIEITSLSGIINNSLSLLGIEPVYFLGEKNIFPWTIILTDIWKNFGFGTVLYLAAITDINQELYEASRLDGASWSQQVWHVTLPGMLAIIVLMATLSIGNILNAGFEQILMLYSPQVYATGDIIDTYVYRIGLLGAQYSFSSAIGLMKSIISFFLIGSSYYLSYKYSDYRIF
jgi:ABC-type polysaccharide transport system, permease component